MEKINRTKRQLWTKQKAKNVDDTQHREKT